MPHSFIHVAASTTAGDHVRKVLVELGREEEVVDFPDALQMGPLCGIDRGPTEREQWWWKISATCHSGVAGLGRVSIRHESGRGNVWFATYAVRIEAVCSASPRN